MAPKGSDSLHVTLSRVEFDGAAPSTERLAQARARLREHLTGHRITVAEIFAAARTLEQDYANAGYLLVRVVVPAQKLDDGATLHLRLIDGYIGAIDTSGLPGSVRSVIARRLANLINRKGLTRREIERRVMLAGDVPGVRLRSTLKAGDKTGETILLVQASQKSVSAFVSADNSLGPALGYYSFGAGASFNSVLGMGERIYVRAFGLPTLGRKTSVLDLTPRNRTLAAGVEVPIGADGVVLALEGIDARTAPRHSRLLPGFASRFRRVSARVRYPLVRSRDWTLTTSLSLDLQDERVSIIDPVVLPISHDRLSVLRAGADLSTALPAGGSLTASLVLSDGIDALGARRAADATPINPLSRQGADAVFRSLRIDATLRQPIADNAVVQASASAQTSFGDPLVNAEQIGLALPNALSPLPAGRFQGDAGYALRGELQLPHPLPTKRHYVSIAPYAFAAVGQVRLEKPTALELRTTTADAFGGGFRFALASRGKGPGVSLSLEYGSARETGVPGRTGRFSLSFITQI